MSRFETNSEPSMEEILASIREIIAGDSRGSQPQPMPKRSPVQQVQRGFMSRDSFLQSPAPYTRPTPEPKPVETYFRPIVPQNEPAPAPSRPAQDALPSSSPRRSMEDRSSDDRPNASRPEPSGEASVAPANSAQLSAPQTSDRPSRLDGAANPETKSASENSGATAAAKEIDAQLAQLVAEDSKEPPQPTDTAAESSVTNDAAAAVVVARQEAKTASIAPAETPEVRAPKVEATVSPSPVRDTSDPFAFDLGPSPFSARAPITATPQTENRTDNIAAALGKVERAIADIRDASAKDMPSPFTTAATRLAPSASPLPSPFSSAPIDPAPRREALTVASVAATLGPNSTLEPLSASFDRPSLGFERPSPMSAPVMPLSAVRETPRPSAPLIATPSQAADRALEDTVADLLRPMLKTWLAENMPKIVERALRREINERLMLADKNAAE